jgi:hypothetical protein
MVPSQARAGQCFIIREVKGTLSGLGESAPPIQAVKMMFSQLEIYLP